MPCASVLKPVYAWLAPEASDSRDLARAAITESSNEATDELVRRIGGLDTLTIHLSRLAGHQLATPKTWGRYQVTTATVKRIYETMVSPDGHAGNEILAMMRDVVPPQRFGVPAGVAMKAGWDLSELRGRHVLVTNIVRVDSWVVTAHAGGRFLTASGADRWQDLLARRGPSAVTHLHQGMVPSHFGDQPLQEPGQGASFIGYGSGTTSPAAHAV